MTPIFARFQETCPDVELDIVIGNQAANRSRRDVACCNGYRDRELMTPFGSLNPRVRKLRQGSFFPGFLELSMPYASTFGDWRKNVRADNGPLHAVQTHP